MCVSVRVARGRRGVQVNEIKNPDDTTTEITHPIPVTHLSRRPGGDDIAACYSIRVPSAGEEWESHTTLLRQINPSIQSPPPPPPQKNTGKDNTPAAPAAAHG